MRRNVISPRKDKRNIRNSYNHKPGKDGSGLNPKPIKAAEISLKESLNDIVDKNLPINIGISKLNVDYKASEILKLQQKYSEIEVEDIAYVTANVPLQDQADLLNGILEEKETSGYDSISIEAHVELYNKFKTIGLLNDVSYSQAIKGIVQYADSQNIPIETVVNNSIHSQELTNAVEQQQLVDIGEMSTVAEIPVKTRDVSFKNLEEGDYNKVDLYTGFDKKSVFKNDTTFGQIERDFERNRTFD
ncbi:MAG: hypothetical protein ABH828_05605 [archaeon]